MLDVRRLRLLRELSHRGTIAAVAEALMFTPSAVSQQLSALEREAGVALLERTGRRVVLTPAGIALVGHAEAVLERLERAAAELAAARAGLAGPLRIGAFPTATRALLPPALAALSREHPSLEPMVDEIDPAEVAPRLRAGDLDVALVHEYDFVPAEPDLALDSRPLLEEPMYLATPRAPAASPDPVLPPRGGAAVPAAGGGGGPEDGAAAAHAALLACRDEPWIASTPGTLCHAMTVRACQAAGFAPRIRHHVDDFGTVLAMVAIGQGVALVPGLGVGGPPEGVRLAELPMRRRTLIAFRRGAGAHPAIAALTAALRAGAGRSRDGVRGGGEEHPEAGAPGGGRTEVHPAAVGGDDGVDDGQAQAGPASRGTAARAVRAVEAVERAGRLLGGHPRAGVLDHEYGLAPDRADTDPHGRARRGVGDGVADEIGRHLP
ncbi:DNA-binding transcriptional LysR family regulator [Planomonospora venezuelensis]|uniref:DNA-binding transcriptional LysR family regulator n=1 Tax=Planomonospora venezuelensis TaxID=1999 RepID=A0A841DAD3_PLAVE|nr:DNA-binding transcriptional LysR family regulator [Planomonospora venezuelensis]